VFYSTAPQDITATRCRDIDQVRSVCGSVTAARSASAARMACRRYAFDSTPQTSPCETEKRPHTAVCYAIAPDPAPHSRELGLGDVLPPVPNDPRGAVPLFIAQVPVGAVSHAACAPHECFPHFTDSRTSCGASRSCVLMVNHLYGRIIRGRWAIVGLISAGAQWLSSSLVVIETPGRFWRPSHPSPRPMTPTAMASANPR
jgi:hypothetical protein